MPGGRLWKKESSLFAVEGSRRRAGEAGWAKASRSGKKRPHRGGASSCPTGGKLAWCGMQVRQSEFRKEKGCLQAECGGALHGHGHYQRYASPDGQECFAVPRYCCTRCRLTTSVLEDSRLPYRSVEVDELEANFERRSEGDAAPPMSEKKSGCFDRAWTAWNRNSRHIAELLGLLLDHTALNSAAECWRALRKASRIQPMLARLWRCFKTSLLGDYRCLKPGTRAG